MLAARGEKEQSEEFVTVIKAGVVAREREKQGKGIVIVITARK